MEWGLGWLWLASPVTSYSDQTTALYSADLRRVAVRHFEMFQEDVSGSVEP